MSAIKTKTFVERIGGRVFFVKEIYSQDDKLIDRKVTQYNGYEIEDTHQMGNGYKKGGGRGRKAVS